MIKPGTPKLRLALYASLFSSLLLPGCAFWTAEAPQDKPPQVLRQLPLQFSAQDKSQWQAMRLPGKLLTAYRVAPKGPSEALLAEATSSASMLRQALYIPPGQLGALQFDWQVDQLIASADMRQREAEDSPVRLILVFEGDRQRFSTQNQLLSELTLSLTGEPLPYATLMYGVVQRLPSRVGDREPQNRPHPQAGRRVGRGATGAVVALPPRHSR